MTKFLATAAVMLALATPALAGSNYHSGTIVVGPEWTTLKEEPMELPKETVISTVRFKTNSDIGKRILRECPNGSECSMELSIDGEPKDHYVESYKASSRTTIVVYTITKWTKGMAQSYGEPARPSALNCGDLWYNRNSIWKQAGYCFKTSDAIQTFGNAGCQYDTQGDVPLSNRDRARVTEITRMESQYCR